MRPFLKRTSKMSKGLLLAGKLMFDSQLKTGILPQLPVLQAPLLLQPGALPKDVEQFVHAILYIFFRHLPDLTFYGANEQF